MKFFANTAVYFSYRVRPQMGKWKLEKDLDKSQTPLQFTDYSIVREINFKIAVFGKWDKD